MPIPSSISDLSTTAASNYPQGSDSPSTLDDTQRAHGSFIAKIRDLVGLGTGTYVPATAGTNMGFIGNGQSWQDVTSSRAIPTTYTNSTGRPIYVAALILVAAGGSISGTVDGKITYSFLNSAASFIYITVPLLVPSGVTYLVSGSGSPAISTWYELR